MWFTTLIVLAIAAFFIIKAVKASTKRREADMPTLARESEKHDGNESANAPTSPEGDSVPGSANATVASVDSAGELRQVDQPVSQADPEEIREMIKILNLAEADSPRLGISAVQFRALRYTSDDAKEPTYPDEATQQDVAERLKRMLS